MRIALLNAPWYDKEKPLEWGVRAGSRWPHVQTRPEEGKLPRYVPFPFFMAIASSIAKEKGHDVLLVDAVGEDISLDEFYKRVEAFQPELIFSESSTPSLFYDLEVFKELHKRFPNAKIASGGSQGTSMIPDFMKEQGLPHYWLGGEFDYSISQLADAIDGKISFTEVDGLIGEGVIRQPVSINDVRQLPSPDFSALPIQNYSDPVCGLPAPVAQVWLSRGCPFKCSFCVWPQVVFGNNKYRVRDIDDALDDIETLINDYGCESFYFDDDTTNVGAPRMLELAQKIKERGLDKYPWSMMARADCMNDKMLEALKDAGLYSIKYGVESINEGLQDACDKGTNLKKFHRAIEYTKELGIKLHLTFMFGIPGETEETIDETLQFAMDIAPDSAQFSINTPFPGTRFYKECEEKGWLITDDWSRFLGSGEAVVETPWLSAEALQRKYTEAMQKWRNFNLQRLAAKQDHLIRELTDHTEAGGSWKLTGDREFAEFIWQKADPEILASFKPQDDNAREVIISRHDEEKYFRRILRKDQNEALQVIRLFH